MDSAQDPTRWWLGAAGPQELLAKLDACPPNLGADHIDAGGPARLGIVAPTDRKLRLARRLVAKGEPWRSGRSDIWFSPNGIGHRGPVAFLFPGVEPTFEAPALHVGALAERLGLTPPELDDSSVAHRSASIVRLGIFCDQVLTQLGVVPAAMAGHSIGEWSGIVAAGVVSPERASVLLNAADLDALRFPDLDFAALASGAHAAAEVVSQLTDVHVSHDNSPNQAVICGPPAQIAEALGRLGDQGVLGRTLAFQSGFHTPVVAPLVELFRADMEALAFEPGATPLWSATTVTRYPTEHGEIVALLLRHLVEQVRFRPLIERLYHEVGVRVFVQAGLGSLAGFVDSTLEGHEHAAISLLSPKRSALGQTHRAVTALWVEGLEVDPDVLEGRPPPAEPTTPAPPKHIADSAAPETRAAAPTSLISASRLSETLDLLTAAAHASRNIVDHLTSGVRAMAPPPAPTPPPPPRTAWPTQPLTLTPTLSLANRPETLDHRLFPQPPGWPHPADGFPIMAMTTQIQMLEDVAAQHAGSDRPVVEVSGVRNMRWLDLSEPQNVEITVTPTDDDTLGLTLGRHCRLSVRVGARPAAPARLSTPLDNARPAPHTPYEMFAHGLMFHGPRFQGITALGPMGDNGMDGDFEHLDTPGSLLDNLGKLIAYWVMDRRGLGEGALPIRVDRIRHHRPLPPPGTPVHCEIRVVELQRDAVTANGALWLPDGQPLCSVDGWTSIVFHRDELMEPLYYAPDRRTMDEPQPGGFSVVLERWPTGPGRELTARRYMSGPERQVFAQMNLLEQRRWVIELVAAKDVVRRWLWEHGQPPCYPIEIALERHGERLLRAVSPHIPDGHDLWVAVSSVNWAAAAIVGDGHLPDIEACLIPDTAAPSAVGDAAATTLQSRNPGAVVRQIAPVTDLSPSRLEVAPQPPFAVAWTEQSATADTPSLVGTSQGNQWP